ncbi:MAG: prephenate dehydratase [Kiritimatiellae bacterium]|nr:prephenate dehydratase [Kiritimatiellia bacterium]
MSLDDLREKIDRIDGEIVRLLNERTQAAVEIGQAKDAAGGETYAPAREKEVLERVLQGNKGPLTESAVREIYREIMSAALALERKVNVAYLGPEATFTHLAARAKFGGSVAYEACETIGDVFDSVQKGRAQYGVAPVENSIEGAVTHTLDELAATPLRVCAEIYLPIRHHLLSKTPRDQVRKIYSNPHVFGQCRHWLYQNMPGVELVAVTSTSRAAEMAAHESGAGAIASRLAAELHGVDVLAEDIQDHSGNTTRFLVIARSYGAPTGQDKTSIMFGVKHKVGALYEALGAFRRYDLNMTKIESRPCKTKAWEYHFFVDFEGHADEERVGKALEELAEHCTVMNVLGSYPKAIEQVTA